MFKLKINLALIALVLSTLIASAQKQIGTYENVVTGVALEYPNLMYNEKRIDEGAIRFLLITSNNKIIITDDQFEEQTTFCYTTVRNVGEKYFYLNEEEKGVLMVDLMEHRVVYHDSKNDKTVLSANIDLAMTLALMETIKKQ